MSTKAVKAQSGIESVESVDELPRGVGRLGTDGEGAVHYFYGMPHWKVWVFVNDDLVHEQAIEPGQVEEWIEFIDKEKGWKTNLYGQSLVEMLEEAVTIKEESGDE